MSVFTPPRLRGSVRDLVVVFADQLDPSLPALAESDAEDDALLFLEVAEESTLTPSHVQRTVFFLAAMRHFAQDCREKGHRVDYVTLDARGNTGAFGTEIVRAARRLQARRLVATHPGEWRVRYALVAAAEEAGTDLALRDDTRFYTDLEEFAAWRAGRKTPVMEHFYRRQRKRHGILVSEEGAPEGGRWNFDADNRESFAEAPSPPHAYTPRCDPLTEEVAAMVRRRLPDLPGHWDPSTFRWPVTREKARKVLRDFIEHRLPTFGPFEDAMWPEEPFLWHSLLSPPLNVGLLSPRECVDAAVAAYGAGRAPIGSVEGFVRQILGWREFIRGIYWTEDRDYRERNALDQHGELPSFYWDGETDMRCLEDSLRPVLDHAYSHHIPRLMVLVNFALVSGVHPRAIGDWFYGMYADSVDWVTTPNTIGMGMHADGGVVGSKPYAASGKYIRRMSPYCKDCPYDVRERSTEDACPFNAFYWDFLDRNAARFRRNHRMGMILKNLDRMDEETRAAFRRRARRLRRRFGIGAISR